MSHKHLQGQTAKEFRGLLMGVSQGEPYMVKMPLAKDSVFAFMCECVSVMCISAVAVEIMRSWCFICRLESAEAAVKTC